MQQEAISQNSPVSIYIPIDIAFGYLVLEDETIMSYRIGGAFCGNCDPGISLEVIAPYLPIALNETIRLEFQISHNLSD